MANLWHVFNVEQKANALKTEHGKLMDYPIIGRNKATNELQPDKAKTERWSEVYERLDGKFCMPQIPAERIDAMPQNRKTAYNTKLNNAGFVLEEYDNSWFNAEL